MEIPIKELALAIASLVPNPSPEFCFLWINWWPLCMTKAEWSGWAQVVGAVLAIWGAARLADKNFERERTAAHADRYALRQQTITVIAQNLEGAVAISKRLIQATTPFIDRDAGDAYRLMIYKQGGPEFPGLAADIHAMDTHMDALKDLGMAHLPGTNLMQKLIDAKFSIAVIRRHMEIVNNSKVEAEWTAGFAFGRLDQHYANLLDARNHYWATVTGRWPQPDG